MKISDAVDVSSVMQIIPSWNKALKFGNNK